MDESDATLIGRARQGDAAAFEALVRRHLRAAYAVAFAGVGNAADAEDVAQDAFVTALQRLEECRHPEKFASWLMSIVRNRGHDFRRYRSLRAALPLDEAPEVDRRADPGLDTEREELRADLEAAVQGLTELQREVVLLYDLEGWSHREIARKLDISEGSARVHLHNARKALRARLSDRYGGNDEH